MAKKKYRHVYLASYGVEGYTVRLYQRVSYDGIVGCVVRQIVSPEQRGKKTIRKRVSNNQSVFTDVMNVKSYEGGCKMIRDICRICGSTDCFPTNIGTLCEDCLEEHYLGGKKDGQQKSK